MLNLPAITSFAVVRQTDPGDITVLGDIDSNSVVYLTSIGGNIHIEGKIDNTRLVYLQATPGNVTIDGKIDGGSTVTLKAGMNVTIGTTGGDDNEKIDGNSTVTIIAGANITFGSKIHKAIVDMTAHGTITLPEEIDNAARVRAIADGNINIGNFIHGNSRAELVSNRASITIAQNVDHSSKVWLTAAGNINIGTLSGDLNIEGDSFVSATSGGTITLGGQINGSNTVVDFLACKSIKIGQGISGGASVRLLTGAGGGSITLGDPITDSGTNVISFPVGAIFPAPTVQSGATFNQSSWAATDTECLATPQSGTWWENWSQTFGYVVAPATIVPHSLAELVAAVAGSGREDTTPVKAVGGGWSFTDASLPMQDSTSVDKVSIMLKGRPGQQDLHDITQFLSSRAAQPMDLLPGAVTRNSTFSTAYNQTTLRQVTAGGAQLPTPSSPVRLIDTRALCSSLQCLLPGIRVPLNNPARGPLPGADQILFHADPMTALSLMMGEQDDFSGNKLIARVFDMLGWQTNPLGFASNDLLGNSLGGPETVGPATGLTNFLMMQPNLLVGAVAISCVQVLGNIVNQSGDPTRGLQFFGDLLSGFFHSLQGTLPGINADSTGIAYKVGAIGWPDTGVPGRGLEIALDQTNAFTFLQGVLFDDIIATTMLKQNKPLVGYISIRVCPRTTTLLGMQQYSPQSVMLEIVGYRSPEGNAVMDLIQQKALAFTGPGPRPILHWGLENSMMDAAHLALTPLGQPYNGSFTRLSAFSAIRQFLRQSHPPVFDNAFTKRMGM